VHTDNKAVEAPKSVITVGDYAHMLASSRVLIMLSQIRADNMAAALNQESIPSAALHGGLSQVCASLFASISSYLCLHTFSVKRGSCPAGKQPLPCSSLVTSVAALLCSTAAEEAVVKLQS
jgi:hypothetical protein